MECPSLHSFFEDVAMTLCEMKSKERRVFASVPGGTAIKDALIGEVHRMFDAEAQHTCIFGLLDMHCRQSQGREIFHYCV
jgi:hypothetical protein